MEREGVVSSCAGQQACQPSPVLWAWSQSWAIAAVRASIVEYWEVVIAPPTSLSSLLPRPGPLGSGGRQAVPRWVDGLLGPADVLVGVYLGHEPWYAPSSFSRGA